MSPFLPHVLVDFDVDPLVLTRDGPVFFDHQTHDLAVIIVGYSGQCVKHQLGHVVEVGFHVGKFGRLLAGDVPDVDFDHYRSRGPPNATLQGQKLDEALGTLGRLWGVHFSTTEPGASLTRRFATQEELADQHGFALLDHQCR